MDDRRGRVERLFACVIELSLEDRQAHLDLEAHPEVRAEVEELLGAHDRLTSNARGFLEHLDATRFGALLEPRVGEVQPQETIGRYRILRLLGQGGMGVVYQAHDPRLGRSVALKLLPRHASADPAAARRLTAEARAASALDHPHIATIYEIGETDDDRVFIAMAYYDGQTLRERIERGRLEVSEAVDLAVQLADGLSAAHRSGIIHRDIKPENILITKDGVLKILDFGVAKVVGGELPSMGIPRGTAAYMAPEQTRGEPVDARADLWALGVVLYEMLVGIRPFRGDGYALVHAIRTDPPQSLIEIRPDLPPALVRLVGVCLEKDRERRFDSADAVAAELRRVISDPVVSTGQGLPDRKARRFSLPIQLPGRAGWFAAAAAMMAVAVLVARGDREAVSPAGADQPAPGVAVLPFEVRGSDLEVWREGMVDLLSTGLEGAPELRAIDSRTVLARWREIAPGPGGGDLGTSLRVARATGARYAVLGSVVPAAADLRLVADIYETESGRLMGQAQVEGPRETVLQLIDRLAIQTLGVILQRDSGLPQIDVASMTSASFPAVKEYLTGELHLRRGEYVEAIGAYERSVEADSGFALGWFGLGLAFGWVEAASNPRGIEAMERALRDPDLPKHQALVARAAMLLDGSVLNRLRSEVRRHPDDARLTYALGELYFHLPELALVGPDGTMDVFRHAIELDPGFAPSWVHFINLAFFVDPDSARIDQAIEGYGRASKEILGHRLAHDLVFGDPETRTRARAMLEEVDDEVLQTAYLDLQHPRYHDAVFPLLEMRLQRAPPHMQPVVLSLLARQSLWAGRVRDGLEYLDDPRTQVDPRFMYCRPYSAVARGLPITSSWLDMRFSTAPVDSTAELWLGCVGAWATDRARPAERARVMETLEGLAGHWLVRGDSIGFRQFRSIARALEGYAAWKRGRPDTALRLLEEARPNLGPYTSDAALPHGWWTGQILLELGRPRDAARYFGALWADPLAHYELAKIYDELGEDAKARAEYEIFVAAWARADPELQPVVERARHALSRLLGERRPRPL